MAREWLYKHWRAAVFWSFGVVTLAALLWGYGAYVIAHHCHGNGTYSTTIICSSTGKSVVCTPIIIENQTCDK